MVVSEDNVRIIVTVSKALAVEIDEYARRFRRSRSKMASMLIENGVESFQFYEKCFGKPEKLWKAAVFLDRVAMRLGLPALLKTKGLEIDEYRKRQVEDGEVEAEDTQPPD